MSGITRHMAGLRFWYIRQKNRGRRKRVKSEYLVGSLCITVSDVCLNSPFLLLSGLCSPIGIQRISSQVKLSCGILADSDRKSSFIGFPHGMRIWMTAFKKGRRSFRIFRQQCGGKSALIFKRKTHK